MAAALRYASETDIKENEQRDILVFLLLSLRSIDNLNEKTITAWEKRGYWVKADRYRMQWSWVNKALKELDANITSDNLQASTLTAAHLAQYLTDIQLSKRKRSMRPWINAWNEWKNSGS